MNIVNNPMEAEEEDGADDEDKNDDDEDTNKDEEEGGEPVEERKLFVDSGIQAGPPSFRMVRFKQEQSLLSR